MQCSFHGPLQPHKRETWDVAAMLKSLCSWGPIQGLSLRQLVHQTLALTVIFSCRRINDLKLLGRSPPWCVLSDSSITLQCRFSLKQAQRGHCSPPIRFVLALDESLCPVRHIQTYLETTAALTSSEALFVTATLPHGPAARVTLCQWFAAVLGAAGIRASPSSGRAGVASTVLARGLSANDVMQAADWSSSHTFFCSLYWVASY